jgi:hypothetical protein
MDPNGFEVGDKCEFGPAIGTPLGFAGPDNAPFNEVINAHKYLIQEMWSNRDNGCVQHTANTTSGLPLPQVDASQFSNAVSGNIGSAHAGVGVTVSMLRAAADGSAVTVAQSSATTDGNGNWSLTLGHPIGDDHDEIDVDYSGAGAPTPNHQVVLTGNGGNPFTESGWTGWTDLDNGSFLTNNPSLGGPSLTLAPCFQTGVLAATFNGTQIMGPLGESPTDFCNTQSDTATIGTPTVGPGDTVTASSNDNRAFSPPIPDRPRRPPGRARPRPCQPRQGHCDDARAPQGDPRRLEGDAGVLSAAPEGHHHDDGCASEVAAPTEVAMRPRFASPGPGALCV